MPYKNEIFFIIFSESIWLSLSLPKAKTGSDPTKRAWIQVLESMLDQTQPGPLKALTRQITYLTNSENTEFIIVTSFYSSTRWSDLDTGTKEKYKNQGRMSAEILPVWMLKMTNYSTKSQ